MKPRLTALTVPETDRYWCVEIEGKGEHHFRFPSYPKAGQAIDCVMAFSNASEAEAVQVALEMSGLLVGQCWYHRGMVLESEPPHLGSAHTSLIAYSESVSEELQDQGYTAGHLVMLYNACVPHLLDWWGDLHGIRAREVDEDAPPAEDPGPPELTTEDAVDPGPFEAQAVHSTAPLLAEV